MTPGVLAKIDRLNNALSDRYRGAVITVLGPTDARSV